MTKLKITSFEKDEYINNKDKYVFSNGKLISKENANLINVDGLYVKYDPSIHLKTINRKNYTHVNNCIFILFIENEKVNTLIFGNSNLETIITNIEKKKKFQHLVDENYLVKNTFFNYNFKAIPIRGIDKKNFLEKLNIPKELDIEQCYNNFLFEVNSFEKFGLKRDNRNGVWSFVESKRSPAPGNYQQYKLRKVSKSLDKIKTNLIAKNDLTFGVEIETSEGNIKDYELASLNLDVNSVRDGSTSGPEFVTGVLKHDQGFYDLYKLCYMVSKTCNINDDCGIHVHIGNATFNKTFNAAAYVLGVMIQNEFSKILQKSRINNPTCGNLNVSLSKETKVIYNNNRKQIADNLFYHYFYKKMNNNFKLSKVYNKRQPHRGGRYCGRYQRFNGRITADQFRYKWLNFIPCNFNQRKARVDNAGNSSAFTLEFRNHHATLNYEEIKDWVLFCMAFVNYVQNNSLKILKTGFKTSIKQIITSSYGKDVYKRMLDRNKVENKNNRTDTKNDMLSFYQLLKNHKKECA